MPDRVPRLRNRAADCRRLADLSTDPSVAEELERVAAQLEQMADEAAREGENFLTAPIPSDLRADDQL